MQRLSRRLLLSIVPAAGLTASAMADAPPPGRRIAIGGFDPVSYFADGGPHKGNEAFWFAFDDAVYLFKNAEHRTQFAADPERYAPQYNGFCAGGLSKEIGRASCRERAQRAEVQRSSA